MRELAAVCLLASLASTCRNPGASEAEPVLAGSLAPLGPGPVVTGTVLDARTGKPVPDARVTGPGGVETRSDARGRFVLRGLAHGVAGELVGTSEAGLRGKNVLRALEGGTLEVVLYLR